MGSLRKPAGLFRMVSAAALWAAGPVAAFAAGPAGDPVRPVSANVVHEEPAGSVPIFRDGIYRAESPGWTGMAVAVHIEDGRLACVEVLKAKGTPRYYDRVVRRLPVLMKEKGSPEVDGITGATLSCNSLKEAVRAALKQARPDTLPSR